MIRRYNCLKLTLLTAALIVGLKPTSVSAQVGCCCFEENGVAPAWCDTVDICTVFGPAAFVFFVGECTTAVVDDPLCATFCANLPVELTSFDALANGSDVLLAWSTASETNNAGFSVEYEVGSNVFAEIGYVGGYGTTREPKEYSFSVNDLDPGLHRFRLKQIDFDGTFEYSAIVEAVVTVPDRFLIEPAYPNPFNPTTTLRFAVAAEQHVEVTLVNAAGQTIRTLYSGTVTANEMQQLTVDAATLPSGTYLVHFNGDGISATERIVLMK